MRLRPGFESLLFNDLSPRAGFAKGCGNRISLVVCKLRLISIKKEAIRRIALQKIYKLTTATALPVNNRLSNGEFLDLLLDLDISTVHISSMSRIVKLAG
jgi:hypothetical protein